MTIAFYFIISISVTHSTPTVQQNGTQLPTFLYLQFESNNKFKFYIESPFCIVISSYQSFIGTVNRWLSFKKKTYTIYVLYSQLSKLRYVWRKHV